MTIGRCGTASRCPRDGAEPVVEEGGLVPGSWDALIMHYKAHNTGWAKIKPKTQGGYLIYHDYISRTIGSRIVAKMTLTKNARKRTARQSCCIGRWVCGSSTRA